MDILTRKSYPKSELLRFVCIDGTIVLDEAGDLPGRGVYLKKEANSLELALKKRCFERAFHHSLSESTLTRVKECIQ